LPHECQGVMEALKPVGDPEEAAREAPLSPAARLASHQASSRPLRDGRTGWLKQQCDDRLVAPNSALGKALAYMPGPWETRTRC
jgi:hypothetical protein